MNVISIHAITEPSEDYELLDSGDGEKLERFGQVIVRRPDPQVLWNKLLPASRWKEAHSWFKDGSWVGRKEIPDPWNIHIEGKHFGLRLAQFKHVGIFPEQVSNWKWIEERIRTRSTPVSVLNLFGYTGGATLAALHAGAEVCHVDGSKTALTAARTNAALSGLADKPVRWMLDDVLTFVRKEIKRSRRYSGIIMDPPAFGHGPNGETWKIEEHFPELIALLPDLLEEHPLFVVVNGYAAGYASVAYANALLPLVARFGGTLEAGEIGIREAQSGRILPAGIVARFLGKIVKV